MLDAEKDLIFFDYINVLSENTTKIAEKRTQYRAYMAAYLNGSRSEMDLRYFFPVPWCKLVKRELIEQNQIRFSEVMWGEDVYFACQVGMAAKAIKVSGTVGYVVISRSGSMMDGFCGSTKEFRVRLSETLKCDGLLKAQYGNNARSGPWLNYVYQKKGFWRCAGFCVANVFHPCVFLRTAAFLYKKMKYGEVSRT